MMLLRVAVAAALALVSLEVVSAQTGFCVGNGDADAEPDVACGTGYALKDGAAAVVRGGGNGHDSEAARDACCDRLFCTQASCGAGRVLKPDAATTLPPPGSIATDPACCEEDYAPDVCVAEDICTDCVSPEAKHGGAESGDGGFLLTTTSNQDGTVTCARPLSNQRRDSCCCRAILTLRRRCQQATAVEQR
jgi:hypothetical protein